MRRTASPLVCVVVFAVALFGLACSNDGTADQKRSPSSGDVGVDDARHHDSSTPDPTDTASADAPAPDADVVGTPDDADASPPEAPTLADGVEITTIRAFQTIETTLVEQGTPAASDVPLIAGRETLFRVYVKPAPGWTPRELTAELVLVDNSTGQAEVLTDTMTVTDASSPDDRTSAFEIRASGASITPTTTASFRLVGDGEQSVDDGAPSGARWPRDGTQQALQATGETGTLHVVLVPMRYDTDGSGRLPDTSTEQIALYEEGLRAVYPAVDIQLEVREAISWTDYPRWGSFNRELRSLKQSDGAEHAYYYGLIVPEETYEGYCSNGCTSGQSYTVSSADSTSYRVGSGLGYTGERSMWTFIHELGHMHGRGHAPCGVSWWSEDHSYPYGDGTVGVRGWDARNDVLFAADQVTDFMGYCQDLWASDYTYLGILERMKAANALVPQSLSLAPETTWRYINWSRTRRPAWGRQTRETDPSTGEWATAVFVDASGKELDRSRVPFIRYSHGGERSVLVPETPEGTHSVRIQAPSTQFVLSIR